MDLSQFSCPSGGAGKGQLSDDDSECEILSPSTVHKTTPQLYQTSGRGASLVKKVQVSKHFEGVNNKLAGHERKALLAKQGYKNTGVSSGEWLSTKKSVKDVEKSKKIAEKARKEKLSKKKFQKDRSPDGVDGIDFFEEEEDGSYEEEDDEDEDESSLDSPSPVKRKKSEKQFHARMEMKKKRRAGESDGGTLAGAASPSTTTTLAPNSEGTLGGFFASLPPPKDHIDLTVDDTYDDFDDITTPQTHKPGKGGRLVKKSQKSVLHNHKPNYAIDDEDDGDESVVEVGEVDEWEAELGEVDDMVEDDDVEEESEAEEEDEMDGDLVEANDLLKDIEALVHDIHSKVDKWSKVVVEGGAFALDQINSDPSSSDANWISADLISKLCPNLKLAPYQVVGVNWLAVLSRQRFRGKDVNGIIGDEMGLGKTVQTIAFLRWFKEYGGGIEEKENTAAPSTARKTFYDSDDEPDPPPPTYKKILDPHLIVVPASVLDNWAREFSKFAPDLEILKYHGSQAHRKDIQSQIRRERNIPGTKLPDVVLTTFTYFSSEKSDDRTFLKKFDFNYLIVDEGHTLKNPEGARYRNLHKFKTKHRILLTGTPVQNNPKELMALLTFLMPLFKKKKGSVYGDETEDDGGAKMLTHFVTLKSDKTNTTDDSNGFDENSGYQKLKNLMAPFILRRRKDQVLSQILPSKTQVLKRVKMSEQTNEIYNNIMRTHAAAKLNQQQSKNIFTELRKVSNQPLLLRTRWTDSKSVATLTRWLRNSGFFGQDQTLTDDLVRSEIAKMSDFAIHSACQSMMQEKPILVEHLSRFTLVENDLFTSPKCLLLRTMLPQLVSEGHRILLFSQWKMNLDILQCLLEALGLKYHRLDGDLKVNERMEIIDSFNNDPSFKVFLLSTRAGGMGINLTSADTCIIHDCDFNPTMDQQAEDRCHRIGQKKPVTVYKLVCEGTVDEGIYNLAVRKMAANKAILNDEQGKGGQAASKGNDKKDISMLVSEAFQKFYETENAKGSIGGIVKAAEAEVSSVPAPVANEKVINLDHSDSDDGCNRKSAQDKNTFFSEDSDSD